MDALQAMRRYVYGFVNSHDFEVCRQLMTDDYLLHMGADVVQGRDEHYIPAVRHQMEQFPNLGFAIHDLLTDGEWTALQFSEHGASAKNPARTASWLGVSMYRFDGERLAECWVEQDHYSRRKQLQSNERLPVPPISVDPWSAARVDPSPGTEQVVRSWLQELTSWPPPEAALDPGPHGSDQPRLEVTDHRLDRVIVSGDRAAFHATLQGRYAGGLPDTEPDGRLVEAHVGAFATVIDGRVASLTGVTNRVAVQRQLRTDR